VTTKAKAELPTSLPVFPPFLITPLNHPMNPCNLSPFPQKGILRAVIETPKGSRNKLDYDPKQKIFSLETSTYELRRFAKNSSWPVLPPQSGSRVSRPGCRARTHAESKNPSPFPQNITKAAAFSARQS
jgi:hypothetical protein